MELLEYQGKHLFKKHDVPVPEGRHAASVAEAVEAAEELGYPVVVKAQVQIGGRGKAGGIKLGRDRAEAEAHAEAILGMDIRGFTVHEVIEAFRQIEPDVPFVVRLDGTNDREGRELLAEANLPNVHTEETMLGAAERVVELAR
jgi:succinyl-CoA synthetase beta subunit